MKKVVIFTALVAAMVSGCTLTATAQDNPDKLTFDNYGFEIVPFDIKTDEQVVAVQFFLPVNSGFAANVNVLIQPYAVSMDDYVAQTEAGLKQIGCRILSQSLENGCLTLQYAGTMSGHDMHFYARAFKRGDKYYLATATGLESRWETEKTQLMQVVDSFALTEKK